MTKKNKKLPLNSGIQTYQILTNDDEVCIPSLSSILASGTDVGQGINVGPGKFGNKNERRALSTHVLCIK